MGKKATDPEDLPKLVRALRTRLRDTQAEFAEFLGVAQTTVSQYEKGRAVPSTEVLVKMMFLSEWTDIGEAIIRHVQQRFGTSAEDDWEERFKEFYAMRNRSGASVTPIFDVSPDVARIIRLYGAHKGRTESQDVFRKAADYIEVELGEAAELPRRARPTQARKRSRKTG